MPLFKPLFIHHNEIFIDKNDDWKSLIPAAPRRRFRLFVITPIFIHHNTIKVSTSNNCAGLAVEGTVYHDNNTGGVFDVHLVRSPRLANDTPAKQPSGVLGELGEKPLLKELDQDELDTKWNQTRQRLGQAKASFEESYKRLEDELVLAKTEL
jgi:hypothetical protein